MCFECLMVKVPRGKQPGLLHPLPIGNRPFETVHADHVGPFLTTERICRYVLVFVDSFTKFVLFYAIAGTSAEETVQCMRRFVGAYGLPKRLVTDRGTSFTAHGFATYCEEQGITHVLVSSRHQ
uniref:Pro-Pol polyprotein n=1 Tax=Schizaphis graminum TaxID=13262 RepID=A0A2S2PJ73_SCHGA